jgi:hypothetical protein
MIDLQAKNNQGEWISLDLTTLDVPINLQVNQIAELKDRQAGYSQSIKLPPTRKNLDALNLPNRIDAVGGMQYEIVECLMYAGSFELVGVGGNMVIKSVTNVIDVQILFGNSDLFTKLQNTLFSETDLGWYKHGYRFFQYPINNNYAMPCASFVKESKDYSIKTGYSESYPFIYFKNAVEKVLQHHGFTLSTDIDTSYFERLAINCNKGFDEIPTKTGLVEKSISPSVYLSGVDYHQLAYSKDPNSEFAFLNYAGSYITFVGDLDGSLNFKLNVISDNTDGGEVLIQIFKNNVLFHEETKEVWLPLPLTYEYLYSDYVAGDSIKFVVNSRAWDNIGYNISSTIETTLITVKTPEYYDNVPLSSLIDINTQLDLIKMFVNEFALTVNVDNDNKVMHAYSMSKLYQNFDDAKDWSKKLDFGKDQQIEFIFSDYAQSNYIRLQDNEDDQVKKSFEFNIANANLAKRKDLFEIPFCATKTITDLNICSVPMVSKSDDGELSFSGGKLHLLNLYDATYDNYPIKGGSDAFSYPDFSNSWQYPLFNTMLNEVKYVTAYFNLTDEDIANYDPFIPVYISYFGQYFYINKIVNYITGKLTKVELLKL